MNKFFFHLHILPSLLEENRIVIYFSQIRLSIKQISF